MSDLVEIVEGSGSRPQKLRSAKRKIVLHDTNGNKIVATIEQINKKRQKRVLKLGPVSRKLR